MEQRVGKHLLVECAQVPTAQIDRVETVEHLLHELIHIAQLTLLSRASHQFSPAGVTSIFLLSESHLSVHTWPEYGTLTLDLFSCQPSTPFEKVVEHLRQWAPQAVVRFQLLDRLIPESHEKA